MVAAPEIYRNVIDVWSRGACGVSTRAAREAAIHQLVPVDATDVTGLAAPIDLAAIDYRTVSTPSVAATGTQIVPPGTAHGLALWFEAELGDGIRYRTGPGSGDELYGVAFLPLAGTGDVHGPPQPLASTFAPTGLAALTCGRGGPRSAPSMHGRASSNPRFAAVQSR